MPADLVSRHFQLHQDILSELGHTLAREARVLDFGCGTGAMVAEYRRRGYEAYGCDPRLEQASDTMRRSDPDSSEIPFADQSFDFVFSDQVLEHVRDHAGVFAEIKRVMKPGAISLHIFPARWKPTE